jgi:hypothetical protein
LRSIHIRRAKVTQRLDYIHVTVAEFDMRGGCREKEKKKKEERGEGRGDQSRAKETRAEQMKEKREACLGSQEGPNPPQHSTFY